MSVSRLAMAELPDWFISSHIAQVLLQVACMHSAHCPHITDVKPFSSFAHYKTQPLLCLRDLIHKAADPAASVRDLAFRTLNPQPDSYKVIYYICTPARYILYI